MIKENIINYFSPNLKPYLMVHVLFIIVLLSLVFSLADLSHLLRNFIVLLIILGLPAYGFINLVYNHSSYIIKNNDISINSGIIFKKTKTISLNSIQSISQRRGPLMSLFGFTSLNIWTASPSQVKIIKGNSTNIADGQIYLNYEEAEDLQKYIDSFRARQSTLEKPSVLI